MHTRSSAHILRQTGLLVAGCALALIASIPAFAQSKTVTGRHGATATGSVTKSRSSATASGSITGPQGGTRSGTVTAGNHSATVTDGSGTTRTFNGSRRHH